jgi:uncharacterized protein YaiL (DUF2058 family)
MSESLRDQLLKMGLVTEKQARQASQPQRRPSRHQPPPPAEATRAAREAEAAKVARDQELNRQRQTQAEAKARIAQIRQWIEQERVPKPQGDDTYNFVYGGKIRRIAIDAELRSRLGRGDIAIVRCEGRFDYVPAATAARIRERDERAVVQLGADAKPVDEDDPYRHHVVPDDLMW